MKLTELSGGCGCADHRVQASPQQLQFVVQRQVSFLFVGSVERLVCDSRYGGKCDMCTNCEETWQTEEDLSFPLCSISFQMPMLRVKGILFVAWSIVLFLSLSTFRTLLAEKRLTSRFLRSCVLLENMVCFQGI